MKRVETGTYGAVEDLARNRVDLNKVIIQWPDMLKVAGSLVTNQVRAYDLLRPGRGRRRDWTGLIKAVVWRYERTSAVRLSYWAPVRALSALSAAPIGPVRPGRP